MQAPYWAVARTEPKRETTAARFLNLAGYAVYVPRIREERSRGGRRIITSSPLFPSYLFVQIEGQWWSARWCVGVAALITAGSTPAKAPDVIIDELRSREKHGFVVLPRAPRMKPGDHVRIINGLLMGQIGTLGALRPNERVEVLLAVIGRATLPAADIETCAGGAPLWMKMVAVRMTAPCKRCFMAGFRWSANE
jgi:transcriptional antiterminator RfaH